MPDKLRVMVDANILVAGVGWPRFPYEVLRHALRDDYTLVLSPRIIKEARMALERIRPARVQAFTTLLAEIEYETVPTPDADEITAHNDLVRDAKDVHVALAAITAGVDYLVTQDKDFTAQDETTARVREQINILLPGTFLREQMGWTSERLAQIQQRNWDDLDG